MEHLQRFVKVRCCVACLAQLSLLLCLFVFLERNFKVVVENMKVTAIVCISMAASAAAFAPQQQLARTPLRLHAEEETSSALVPIKEETVEFTAGIIGAAAGFVLGGPVLGAIGAAVANYASKMENEASDVVQAVSKSSIQVYNYLSELDGKYELLKKAQGSLQSALDKLKAQDSVDAGAVKKVEDALATTTSKIEEINDEYDLVGGATTALGVVGDLVEKAVVKAGELNSEYKLTDKALESLNGAVSKAKDAAASKL